MGVIPALVMLIAVQSVGKLSKAKAAGSAFLKDAPLAFVVLGDPQVSDVWVEDASIALIIIQLVAQSLGLGTCWIQIRKRGHDGNITSEDYVKDLLGILEGKKVESIISIGYPDEERSVHKIEDLKFDKVYRNKYGL